MGEGDMNMVAKSIVEAILGTVFQTSFEHLGPELLNFWGVNEEVKKLEITRSKIQVVLNGTQARMRSDIWMDELRELSNEMKQIADEMNTERLRSEQAESDQVGTYQVSNFLMKIWHYGKETIKKVFFGRMIKKRINEVLGRLNEYAKEADALGLKNNTGGTSVMAQVRQETSPFVDESEVHGRENDKENLIDSLLTNSPSISIRRCQVIPIVGRGGIGKTTLAQIIFKDQRVESHFDLQSWACASNASDIAKITKDLLEYVTTENYSNRSLGALQRHLQDAVKDKKCLIVVDDIRTMKGWAGVDAPFSRCAYGSKILVTTRERKIADAIRTMDPYELQTLGDSHSWELFKENAFRRIDAHIDDNLRDMGIEIVKKCQGVPRAIKEVGTILQDATEERWASVLQTEFCESVDEDNDDFFPALRAMHLENKVADRNISRSISENPGWIRIGMKFRFWWNKFHQNTGKNGSCIYGTP